MKQKPHHPVRLGIRVTHALKDRLMRVAHEEGHDNISIVARRLFAQLEEQRGTKAHGR